MEDEKEVLKVENTGDKGNPNHVPAGDPEGKGGQFTSADGTGGGVSASESADDDEMGVIELQEAPKDSVFSSKLGEFLTKKRETLDKEAREFSNNVIDSVPDEQKQLYSELTRDEKVELLKKSPVGYDEKKLKRATDEQINALLLSEAVTKRRVQLEQELLLWEKQKNDINDSIKNELAQNNIDGISGVWAYTTKYPADWKELKESGSIDKKKEYYEGVLSNEGAGIGQKGAAKQFLKKLEEFEIAGQEYEKLKSEIELKHIDELEEIEAKSNEIKAEIENFSSDSPVVLAAKDYQNKFVDVNSAYSKARKDGALWFKNFSSSYNHFSPKAKEHWLSMSSVERNVIQAYTGSGYSRFNKPLRGIKHDPSGYSFDEHGLNTFSEGVNNLTNAIDKCTWDEDIWVNRFIKNHTSMFVIPGKKGKHSLESMSDEELKLLENTTFTDGGFFSAGAAKGTGYHTGQIVFNVYCPKGTHMAYVAPYSTAGEGENEMILQRGYSYRITKVERKGSAYFLDMEVILGSDKTKPMGNDLKKLGNEYYYKPRGQKGEDYE